MPYTDSEGETIYNYRDIMEEVGGDPDDAAYLWRKAGIAGILEQTDPPPGNTKNRKWFSKESKDRFLAWYWSRSRRAAEIVSKGDLLTYAEVRERLGVTAQAIFWYQKERGLLKPVGSWKAKNGRWVSLVDPREVEAVEKMRAGQPVAG